MLQDEATSNSYTGKNPRVHSFKIVAYLW